MTRDHGILAGVAALVVLLSLATDTFLTPGNLVNLLDQAVVVGLLACGMTLCVICGVFDLSAGAVLAVSAIVAVVVTEQAGVPAGYAAAVATGALLGTVNGVVVVLSRVHSFIVTLALGLVHRGLALVVTGGAIVYPGPSRLAAFQSLSWPTVLGGVTAASLLLVAVAVVTSVLLSGTTFGRRGLRGRREPHGGLAVRDRRAVCPRGRLRDQRRLRRPGRAGAGRPGRLGAVGHGDAAGVTAIRGGRDRGTSILGGQGAIWRAWWAC
ncbi:hypothetical protein GCM10020220_091910 [Nonomuraea rubra]|uniref:ABC transporter permease n=1 Tax=Nonomuraea rubra TaxID=46180 RepID=UPI0031EB10E9